MQSPEMAGSDYEQKKLERTAQELEYELNNASSILIGWYHSRDSDSLSTQRIRASGFKQISGDIESIFNKTRQIQKSLQLTIGEQEVTGWNYSKGAYDFYSASPVDLEPGQTVEIKNMRHFADSHYKDGQNPKEFYSRMELYIGDYRALVPISSVAKTLAEGGQLTLVEKEPDTQEAPEKS